jgi:hypothetical protein
MARHGGVLGGGDVDDACALEGFVGAGKAVSAAAPETTAAACEVPEPRKPPSIRAAGNASSRNEPGTRTERMATPGATTSGERVSEPLLENGAMPSSANEGVAPESTAPTATT